jgi:hypothetical protein
VRLSHEKVIHISHLLVSHVQAAGSGAVLKQPPNDVRLRIVETMKTFLKREEACAEKAKNKIRSLSRKVPEGSAEWDALYRQNYQEEMSRLRKVK